MSTPMCHLPRKTPFSYISLNKFRLFTALYCQFIPSPPQNLPNHPIIQPILGTKIGESPALALINSELVALKQSVRQPEGPG